MAMAKSRRSSFPSARFASICKWRIALKPTRQHQIPPEPALPDPLNIQRAALIETSERRRPVLDCQAALTVENEMHSILFVIPKLENNQPDAGQIWKSILPGLQQRAAQTKCVKTLYENCWLIPAEENGLSFFNHAITVVDDLNLRCRICLLKTPGEGFAARPPIARLDFFVRRVRRAIRRIRN